MIENWNRFVYDLSEAKKRDVEEDTYHSLIETQLQQLGWAKWNGEICHKPNVPIGNSNSIQPDILIRQGEDDLFVIEVKRPVHQQTERERIQLESYMRQLKIEVGVYIGEHIEVFYDRPKSKNAISVLKVPLEINSKAGARFVENFSKDSFSKEAIVEFCEQRINEIERQASLNKIRESLIADAQTQITESLKPYLMDKYGDSFSEEEIVGMLATMHFTATANGSQTAPAVAVSQKTVVSSPQEVKCKLTRNAVAQGVFDIGKQTLTVLKGSEVNPVHLANYSESGKMKRDLQLAEHTEEIDGKRIVKEDVCFDSPSGAASFCVGGSANGWTEWEDENGRKLDYYRRSEEEKTSHAVVKTASLSDSRGFQFDFWTKFMEKLQSTNVTPKLQTPRPRYWYDVRIGRSHIFISNFCNTQKNAVGVRLYIMNQVVERYYPTLLIRRSEIDRALGCEPEWDANPTAKDKTIALLHQTDLSDHAKVEEALNWMVKQTVTFYRVFSEEVKKM